MNKKLIAESFMNKSREIKGNIRAEMMNRYSVMGSLLNYIRLPVSFSSRRDRKSLSNLNFYFYCYSLQPQIYWLKKGTYVTIEDSRT